VKGIPQTIRGKTRRTVILDGFGSRELSFLDPIHKLPGTSALICDLFDFAIEE